MQKHPDVTTKHGKLKSKRKNPPTTIYVDDLAALDSLSEVYNINIIYNLKCMYIHQNIYKGCFFLCTGENSQSTE